jgi:hypothetical protein
VLGITQDSNGEESEATTEPGTIRPRLTRELRALDITSTEAGLSNESVGKSTDASNEGNEPSRKNIFSNHIINPDGTINYKAGL